MARIYPDWDYRTLSQFMVERHGEQGLLVRHHTLYTPSDQTMYLVAGIYDAQAKDDELDGYVLCIAFKGLQDESPNIKTEHLATKSDCMHAVLRMTRRPALAAHPYLAGNELVLFSETHMGHPTFLSPEQISASKLYAVMDLTDLGWELSDPPEDLDHPWSALKLADDLHDYLRCLIKTSRRSWGPSKPRYRS